MQQFSLTLGQSGFNEMVCSASLRASWYFSSLAYAADLKNNRIAINKIDKQGVQ